MGCCGYAVSWPLHAPDPTPTASLGTCCLPRAAACATFPSMDRHIILWGGMSIRARHTNYLKTNRAHANPPAPSGIPKGQYKGYTCPQCTKAKVSAQHLRQKVTTNPRDRRHLSLFSPFASRGALRHRTGDPSAYCLVGTMKHLQFPCLHQALAHGTAVGSFLPCFLQPK